ncbi:MAG: molybdopterin-dependent oxidoreductase [Chloroflexi bacterium]|nr:molybdopterin-dependent oxidoreductase [Chloroflexota bacterium]
MLRQDDSRRQRVVHQLMRKHSGEETVYTGCYANCGGNCQCTLKVRRKNGVITMIEPDDRYNAGVGREDDVLSEQDIIKGRVQRRACPMAWVFHKLLYHPQRILHPLQRAPGSERGEGKFVRISWDEALDTLVGKMEECREKYGPYSVMTPYMPNAHLERLFGFWKAGVDTWGWCSYDPERLSAHLMVGRPGWEIFSSSSPADLLLNTKMIVLWGFEPTMAHHGPGHLLAWYIKMARERGVPIICIDPRYTTAAEVLADQWIPIKPGTDMAFILAVAYVLYKEDLYDKEFVNRFVEPKGFEKWRRYVLGLDDGVAKTPEWAASICAVPAETIEHFTRLYARMKPTWLWKHWSVSRKSYGENSTRGAAILQAMMGYFGVPGGVLPINFGAWDTNVFPGLRPPVGEVATDYVVPKICRSHKWAKAVLLLDKVRSGELSEEAWRSIVGYKGPPELPIPKEFNPKMLMWGGPHHTGSNPISTATDCSSDQVAAMMRMEFIPYVHTTMTSTARYADLILPALDWMWEQQLLVATHGYGGLGSLNFCPGVVDPPGEVRPMIWVYTKIAEKLGFAKQFNRYYTSDDNWNRDWDRYSKDVYELIARDCLPAGSVVPSWEKFKEKQFLNLEEFHDAPYVGFTDEIQEGKPFSTKSGKFEPCCDILDSEQERGQLHSDHLGRIIDNLPNDWRSMQPIPVYQPAVHGFEDPLVKEYPLMMLTPHSRYRVHTVFWNVEWLKGDVYRHGVWLSIADARSRQIKDGDLVRVFNNRGELFLPAYVTSRIMPGVVVVRQGAWYSPNPEESGAPHVLLGDEDSPVTAPHATTLVQAEKARR